MKLNEWKDSSGNKITTGTTASAPRIYAKNTLDQTDRYKSLIAQIEADGISTYTLNSLTDTELDFTVSRSNAPLNIKIIYDAATDTYTLKLLGRTLEGCDYKVDILELLVIGKIIKDTNLCESASLSEFVDKNGKKVNINTTSTIAAAASTKSYPDHTERYKKLLAQIDSDGFCKYTVNLLDDRILAITLNNGVGVKIIFKPYVPCYLVQVDGYDNNCKDWDEVLKLLIIEGIIGDTELCEWLDSKGNKINTGTASSTNASAAKTNKEKFTHLLYYIMKNRGSQVLDSKVLGLSDVHFTYKEMRRLPTGQEELIATVNFYDDHWQLSIYKNGKFVDGYSGSTWETLLEALEGYYNVPTSGTKEYDRLCESSSYADDFKIYEDMWNS